MSYRSNVNSVLRRATGYELRKPQPAKRATPPPAPRKPAAPKPKPAVDTRAQRIPKDFDESMADIVRQVLPYTMTSFDKLHATITAARYVARYNIPGDVIECGVWRGGSMQAIALALASMGDRERHLYLYDTFEGMTPPTEQDVRYDGTSAADSLAAKERSKESMVWAYATLEDVQAGFENVPYPEDRVHYVKGPVEETVPATLPDQVALLRLDTDWYASTAHELTHMYDRLVSGGVLMIDDYGHWQGSRQATDEFLERTGEKLLLVRTGSGRIAVKP